MLTSCAKIFRVRNSKQFIAKIKHWAESYSKSNRPFLCASRGVTTTPFPEFDRDPSLDTHEKLYDYSINHSEAFWGTLAKTRLTWTKDFTQIRDCDINEGKIKWFMDGVLNASGIRCSNSKHSPNFL